MSGSDPPIQPPAKGTRSNKPSAFQQITNVFRRPKTPKSNKSDASSSESDHSNDISDSSSPDTKRVKPSSSPIVADFEHLVFSSSHSQSSELINIALSQSTTVNSPSLPDISAIELPEMPTPAPRARAIELPPFEGKRTDNISDYVHSFKRIKKANNWDDDLAMDHLKCSLRGIAGDWLRRYEKVAANAAKPLDQFLDDLQSNLRAQSDSHMAERELYTRFQKKRRGCSRFCI
jgi:hypothetical protein